MANIAAVLAGVLAVVFSISILFQRSLYAAAICLLVVLVQSSVLFFLFGEGLLAFLQIMISAGAVMVLVVITIMASPSSEMTPWSRLSVPRPVAFLGLLVFLFEILVLICQEPIPFRAMDPSFGMGVGPVLFKSYAPASEAAGLLMFLASLAILERKKTR